MKISVITAELLKSKYGILTLDEVLTEIKCLEKNLFYLTVGDNKCYDISNKIYELECYLEIFYGIKGIKELDIFSHLQLAIVRKAKRILTHGIFSNIVTYSYSDLIVESVFRDEGSEYKVIDVLMNVIRDTVLFYGEFDSSLTEEQIQGISFKLVTIPYKTIIVPTVSSR